MLIVPVLLSSVIPCNLILNRILFEHAIADALADFDLV